MIYDGDTMFFWQKAVTEGVKSDVISNGKGGDAYDALWVSVTVNKQLGAAASVELSTSDTDAMGSPTVLGTYTLAKEKGSKIMVKLPMGAKKFLQLKISGASSGTVTAALVRDVTV